MKARVAAIIIQEGRILLIHRRRDGVEYFTLPGGGIEEGESPEDACTREILEETGLNAVGFSQVLKLRNQGRLEHYFRVDEVEGIPRLGGPESERNSTENSYALVWLYIDKLKEADLRPSEIKRVLI